LPAQEKVLAQVEAAAKSAPPKPKKAPKPKKSTVTSVVDALSFKAGEPGEAEEEEEEEEEEDPVEAALAKYGIITENPWEKGVKCAPIHSLPHVLTLPTQLTLSS